MIYTMKQNLVNNLREELNMFIILCLNKKIIRNSWMIEISEHELMMLYHIALCCLNVKNSSTISFIMEHDSGTSYL